MDLVLPTLEVSVGDDFELNLEFTNRSNQRRIVEIYVSGSVVYYTGVTSSEFLFRDPIVTIGPNKSEFICFFSLVLLIKLQRPQKSNYLEVFLLTFFHCNHSETTDNTNYIMSNM